MLFFRPLYQIPTWFQRMYRGVLWRKDSSCKCVYLTFDDGPVPQVTPQVLDILDRYGVKATFFWVGENVSRYPDLAREVVARGHRFGNHTYNHLPGLKNSDKDYFDNIRLCDEIIRQTMGEQGKNKVLFRPPHGRMRFSQKTWLGKHYQIVLWDVITHDYDSAYTPEQIIRIVRRTIRKGSIILFHDSIKACKNTLPALPEVIEYLQNKGYEFRTL